MYILYIWSSCKLDPSNYLVPFKSNSLHHRLLIETSLISLCRTVKGNKASSDNRDMRTLGPIVLKAAVIDWKVIAEAQPTCLNPDVAPRKYQRFFSSSQSHRDNSNSVEISLSTQNHQVATHNYNLRPRN